MGKKNVCSYFRLLGKMVGKCGKCVIQSVTFVIKYNVHYMVIVLRVSEVLITHSRHSAFLAEIIRKPADAVECVVTHIVR